MIKLLLLTVQAAAAMWQCSLNPITDAADAQGKPRYVLQGTCESRCGAPCVKEPEGYSYNTYDWSGSAFVHSPSKQATWDAAVAAESAMSVAAASQECGRSVKALMLVRNAPKGLSNAQKKQMIQSNRDTIALLDAGSLDAARAEILATTADGVIVTDADKAALVARLDSCKP